MPDECLVGWDRLDQADNSVRGYLLKAAGTFCGKLLSAESRFRRNPFEREARRGRDEATVDSLTASVRRSLPPREGVLLRGSERRYMLSVVEDVAGLISDTVNGQSGHREPVCHQELVRWSVRRLGVNPRASCATCRQT